MRSERGLRALVFPRSSAHGIHNGLIDRRPALVARCHGTADVQAAVRFGRERGLEIAVRGGGHNVAGLLYT
jgi:FAD/FMN-containing dehydrogenase